MWTEAYPSQIDETRELPDESSCGDEEEDEANRIYNDETASINDHPWYALIVTEVAGMKSRCGGSIINSRFIVSGKTELMMFFFIYFLFFPF